MIMFQIPLGVLLFNKNKLDEMSHILEAYMDSVPTSFSEGQLVLPNGSLLSSTTQDFSRSYFGWISSMLPELEVHRHLGKVKIEQQTDWKAISQL